MKFPSCFRNEIVVLDPKMLLLPLQIISRFDFFWYTNFVMYLDIYTVYLDA
jgi:hypothetical protein